MPHAQLITADELAEISTGKRCELIDGVVRDLPPAGYDHGRIAGNVFGLLWTHVRRNELGAVCAAETGFVLRHDPDTVRAADVSFVRADRAMESQPRFFPGTPDLVVEVVSPGDRAQDVDAKIKTWLGAGTIIAWVVWPQTRRMSVHRTGQDVLTFSEHDTLDGGEVLPGFSCKVAEIFE
jgi:Uma2 family endonuclease